MAMMLQADTTPLLEAIAARNTQDTLRETLRLLGQRQIAPGKIVARVGVAALWGGAHPHAVSALSVTGRIAEWMRLAPLGPEPGEEDRRAYRPALPLVQGFLAVADAIGAGMREEHPALPDPLEPSEIKHPDGPHGELRASFEQGNVAQMQRVLMGYYATGADYRTLEEALYITLRFRYPQGGHPVSFTRAAGSILDMAIWGNHAPALISWLPPLMVDATPDTPAAAASRAYAAAPEHDLAWLRTRLTIAKEEAAGQSYREALFAGDATAACEATLAALRAGASPKGVAAGLALAVAERINGVAEGDSEHLLRVGHVLLYVNSVHAAMLHTQHPQVWPLLYTAAAAVNELGALGRGSASLGAPASASVPIGGGLIAASLLRAVERQAEAGDAANALASARRYAQMGHDLRALAGALGSVAALRDITGPQDASIHALPLVAAAAEEYLALPPVLQGGGQNALLAAGIRLASELRGPQSLADAVNAAIEAQVRGAAVR